MIKISYLIVNYNALVLLKKFLAGLQPSLSVSEYEIIIYDNASTDGSFEYFSELSKTQQNLEYIYSQTNVGFGQGMNRAAKVAKGATLVIINPDIEFPKSGFDQFVLKHVAEDVIFSPQIVDIQTGRILPNAGGFSSFFAYLLQLFKVGTFVRRLGLIEAIKKLASYFSYIEKTMVGKYLKNFEPRSQSDRILADKENNNYLEADWISGACIIIDANLFKKLNGFDDRIFIYCEDEDLCRRAGLYRAVCRVYSDFQIAHWVGATMGSESLPLSKGRRERFKSNMYYLKKWESGFHSRLLLFIYVTYFLVAGIGWALRFNFKLSKDRLSFARELFTHQVPKIQC